MQEQQQQFQMGSSSPHRFPSGMRQSFLLKGKHNFLHCKQNIFLWHTSPTEGFETHISHCSHQESPTPTSKFIKQQRGLVTAPVLIKKKTSQPCVQSEPEYFIYPGGNCVTNLNEQKTGQFSDPRLSLRFSFN